LIFYRAIGRPSLPLRLRDARFSGFCPWPGREAAVIGTAAVWQGSPPAGRSASSLGSAARPFGARQAPQPYRNITVSALIGIVPFFTSKPERHHFIDGPIDLCETGVAGCPCNAPKHPSVFSTSHISVFANREVKPHDACARARVKGAEKYPK